MSARLARCVALLRDFSVLWEHEKDSRERQQFVRLVFERVDVDESRIVAVTRRRAVDAPARAASRVTLRDILCSIRVYLVVQEGCKFFDGSSLGRCVRPRTRPQRKARMSLLRIALVVVLAAAALSALPGTAAAQEEPVEVPPVFLPQGIGEGVPDLRQRHPWIPGDHPFPLAYTYARGEWKWPNGSNALVYCLIAVTADNPNWRQEDMRYTRFNGGARCNYQMGSITGITRLYNHDLDENKRYLLAEAPYGAQHEVPPDQGEGWQAYGMGFYTRTSDNQQQQIRTELTIELPFVPGARWDEYEANFCKRDGANVRIIRCNLNSPGFRHVPYPCPPGKVGLQPGETAFLGTSTCAAPPPPCPSGQIGFGSSCLDITPPETTITSGPSDSTSSTSASFSFTSSEPGSFQCSLDGAGFTACSSPKTYTALSDGQHTFEVRAIDRAGNVDPTPARREWSVHAPPPLLSLSGPLVEAQGTPLTDDVYELWIDAGSTAGMQSLEVKIDGARADYVSEPCGADNDRCAEDYVFDFTPGAYTLGNHTVTVVARDRAGGTSQGSVTANVAAGQDSSTDVSATAAPQSGTGPGCAVFDSGTVEEGVALVVHGTWSGGPETTEYFSSRDYRLSRCSVDGDLAVQQRVSAVGLPDGSLVSIVLSETLPVSSAELPAGALEPQYLTSNVTHRDPAGTTAADWLIPSAAVLPPTPTSEQLPDHTDENPGGTDRGCTSDQFVRLHRGWQFNPRYRVHRDSLPAGAKSRRRIVGGHNVWNKTGDNCGLRDRTDFTMVFDGMTGQPAAVRDGRDTVDFGPLSGDFAGCSGGVGCAATLRNSQGNAVEVDIRFAANPPGGSWYSGIGNPPADRYDLKSTAAHEAGHKLGLDHVARRTDQTMCSPCAQLGVKYRRTLGRGDVLGLRRIYQGRNLGPDPR